MKLICTLTLFFSFLMMENTKASSLQGIDLEIYQETLANCSAAQNSLLRTVINPDSLKTMLITTGQTLDNVIVNSNPEEITTMLENHGLGVYASDRLSSLGFIQALQECFPNSPQMQKTYVISFIAADTLAKVPVIFATMASFSGFSKLGSGFSKLGSFLKISCPKTYRILIGTSIVSIAYASIQKARKELLNEELSPEEEMRVNQIKENIDNGLNENAAQIAAEGNDVINALKEKLETERDPTKIKKIKTSIAEISGNLAALNDIK